MIALDNVFMNPVGKGFRNIAVLLGHIYPAAAKNAQVCNTSNNRPVVFREFYVAEFFTDAFPKLVYFQIIINMNTIREELSHCGFIDCP